MEEAAQCSGHGSRFLNMRKSYKLGVRSLLRSCPKEAFCNAFPKFTSAEQEQLHSLFIQIVTSLHDNLENEFEYLCLETKVGSTLDVIEQLVEEQSLDPLFSEKVDLQNAEVDSMAVKKNGIQFLKSLLDEAEARKNQTKARVELLRTKMGEISAKTMALEKLKHGMTNHDNDAKKGI